MADEEIIPVSNPDGGFRTWHEDEIYTGPDGTGRYVPNVNDAVWSWITGMWRVTEVDYTTGLSVLTEYVPIPESEAVNQEDILVGGGPGYVSESFRLYVNDSVTPNTIAVDSWLRIYGTAADTIKIFRGTDISFDDGEVISRLYDSNGDFIGENIPLQLVESDSETNLAVRTMVTGYTTSDLVDGEVVTAVVYSDAGEAISINKLIVKKTAFIRSTDIYKRYITSIEIESPFISDAEPNVLQWAINMPVQALNMTGVVNYSDGGIRRLPIDGTKFTLLGIDNFIATIQGQRVPLVLTYKLGADEAVYEAEEVQDSYHLSVPYFGETIAVEGAYSVKLFTYPVWIDNINGYRLEYYLYNLDRDEVYYATPYVSIANNSIAFNPTLFGTTQNITVAVNLNEVNGLFDAYRHVQTIGVTLYNHGNVDDRNWTIQYTPNVDPVFGGTDFAARVDFINVELYDLYIGLEAENEFRWLDKIYWPTQPLYDPTSEAEAPTPNFFKVYFDNKVIEYPLEQYNEVLRIDTTIEDGSTLFIEFIKRTANDDLQLAIAAMPVHYNISG